MVGYSESVWTPQDEPDTATRQVALRASCDLLVIGGGISGLATALHAARRGLGVVVVESGRVGDGASGRNGGQVIPGLKYDPDVLLERFGLVRGEALVRFAAGTADAVFDLIREEKLKVRHERKGWIQACHTDAAMAAARERHRQWSARGADVDLMDAAMIERAIGTSNYHGGFLDRRAGVIDPLAFTRELARLVAEAGGDVVEKRSCERLERAPGGWRATLSGGEGITARKVFAAANAYSDALIPGLERSLVALHSFQIATEPLAPGIARDILPGGQAVSDSRRILVYYRRTPDGRLMLGGRGAMRVPTDPSDWAHLEHAMVRLFPSLDGVRIDRRWFGRVAMTPDHLPHIHEPAPGLLTVVGCQGRGVGLMTAMAGRLADYLVTDDRDALPLPVTPIRPIPFHGLRNIGVGAMIALYRFLDAIEH